MKNKNLNVTINLILILTIFELYIWSSIGLVKITPKLLHEILKINNKK